MLATQLDAFRDLYREVEAEAGSLLDRYREIFNEVYDGNAGRKFDDACKFVRFDRYAPDEDELRYEGDEYWSYGGHEHYSMALPARYLADPHWEEDVRSHLLAVRVGKEAEDQKKLDIELEKRRREYVKLKAEFEEKGDA